MTPDQNHAASYLRATTDAILGHKPEEIARVIDLLYAAYDQDKQILICGNGGSAATATHLAGDLQKGTKPVPPKRFRALCLADNATAVTAWGNDEAYASTFVRQLESLAQPGDVFVGISVSGRSPNVIEAAQRAKALGLSVVGLTGAQGEALRALADVSISAPNTDVEMVEDAHMVLVHVLVSGLRRRIHA